MSLRAALNSLLEPIANFGGRCYPATFERPQNRLVTLDRLLHTWLRGPEDIPKLQNGQVSIETDGATAGISGLTRVSSGDWAGFESLRWRRVGDRAVRVSQ